MFLGPFEIFHFLGLDPLPLYHILTNAAMVWFGEQGRATVLKFLM